MKNGLEALLRDGPYSGGSLLICGRNVVQQAIGFPFDNFVAFTAQLLEFRPVKHSNMSTVVFDYALPLQLACGLGNPLPADAQHVGDQLLCHVQLVVG